METENCRGNVGLKDQAQALRWIRANINRFGGDPNNVTIAGHGTGATCVNLHMISPLTKGLFHKAIVQSGGIYCPWGFYNDENICKYRKKLFPDKRKMVNEIRAVLVEVFKEEDADVLLKLANKIVKNNFLRINGEKLSVQCGPSIEKIKSKDSFIANSVEDLMKTARSVPVLAGICESEGHELITAMSKNYPLGFDDLVCDKKQFASFLARNLHWNMKKAWKNVDYIRNRYFNNLGRMNSQQVLDRLAVLITNIWYLRFYDNFEIGEDPGPLYVYKFSYATKIRPVYGCKERQRLRRLYRTSPSHGDDLDYLYDRALYKKLEKMQDYPEVQRMIHYMCHMWTTFCRTGFPIRSGYTDWLSHSKEVPRYLNIAHPEQLTMTRSSVCGPFGDFLRTIVEYDKN